MTSHMALAQSAQTPYVFTGRLHGGISFEAESVQIRRRHNLFVGKGPSPPSCDCDPCRAGYHAILGSPLSGGQRKERSLLNTLNGDQSVLCKPYWVGEIKLTAINLKTKCSAQHRVNNRMTSSAFLSPSNDCYLIPSMSNNLLSPKKEHCLVDTQLLHVLGMLG
jgi:hypothetical protein